MKKKTLTALVLGAAMAVSAMPVMAEEEPDYASMKIVLILPGSIDDQSWNASNNAGALACDEQLGTSIEVGESVPVEEFESTFMEYGEKGYDLVMSAGSQFDEACAAVAPQYPDTVYTVINGQESDSDNMVPVFPKEYEGSYLAGLIAGYVTENGADTVFCYSNEGASGAVQSAAEKDAKFVAYAANKNDESDCVVASVNMNWANVYPWIIEGVATGELTGAQEVGVAEGVFEVIYTDQCSQECQDAVEAAIEEITAGNIDFTQYFSEADEEAAE